MFESGRDFVFKLVPIDGRPTAASASRITALQHEVGYYSVENEAIEVVALCECGEVGACLRGVFGVQLNDDAALDRHGD